jgi:hypothetical protein
MHNDFWYRNVFLVRNTIERSCRDGITSTKKQLNKIQYFRYNLATPGGTKKDIYIKAGELLPIVSDFGFSEFITDNGEYIFNGDYGDKNPCKNTLPNNLDNKINYLWYSDILYFLVTTLHASFNDREKGPYGDGKKMCEQFINRYDLGASCTKDNVKRIIDELQRVIRENDSSSRHKNIIRVLLIAIVSIFKGSTMNRIDASIRSGEINLHRELNRLWAIYFFIPEVRRNPEQFPFDSWVSGHGAKHPRINLTNYGKPVWEINETHKTILPFALELFEYLKDSTNYLEEEPSGIKKENILNIVLNDAVPRFTNNIEKTTTQYASLLRRSDIGPKSITIGGRNYGGPSYIKPIDKDTAEANVVYYSYENIAIPGLSNQVSHRGEVYYQDGEGLVKDKVVRNAPKKFNWKQFINVIVIKNPNETSNTNMIFERQQLMDTLKNIFSNSKNNYVNTDWGVALSGGYFKLANYLGSGRFKHCNNIKNEDGVEEFNRLNCFKNMGYIRDNGKRLIYNDVPANYKEVYASVCVSGNSISIIQPDIDSDSKNRECGQVLTTGPLLVRESAIVFSENLIQQCKYRSIDTGNDTGRCSGTDDRPLNGRGIIFLAGWLNHGFNLNPRAAFGIDATNNIYLVTFEGRSKRGDGFDLTMCAKIMKALGCVSSINLDGGGTADLLYKLPNSSCYTQTNPLHLYKYPAASLENTTAFSFTSKPQSKKKGGKTNKKKLFKMRVTKKQ